MSRFNKGLLVKKSISNLLLILMSSIMWMGLAQAQEFALDPICGNMDGGNVSSIRNLIDGVNRIEFGESASYEIVRVYPLLAQLNKRISRQEDIQVFRCLDDLQTIRKLVALARIDERGIRINASLLLANVVDNTTLCGVLEELLDHTLDENVRYNLWQVVLVVAEYARIENKAWSKQTILDNRSFIGSDALKYEKTLRKIDEVEASLSKNERNVSLLPQYSHQYLACRSLPNISKLWVPTP